MKHVVVVGAGPGGLCASWELATNGVKVSLLEKHPSQVGGLSRTVTFQNSQFDLGPHRFFTKNEFVMNWWKDRLNEDFLRIKRQTRILHGGKFFQYPLILKDTLKQLGTFEAIASLVSYAKAKLLPFPSEETFEAYMVNRFGERTYNSFFKSYTEKVWGERCDQISSHWAKQRIQGINLTDTVLSSIGFRKSEKPKTFTDHFYYPKFGAGMMWNKVAQELMGMGGRIYFGETLKEVVTKREVVSHIQSVNTDRKETKWIADAFVISSPLSYTLSKITPAIPREVLNAGSTLKSRSLVLALLLLDSANLFEDQWLYVHDSKVKIARITNFNNWGGYLNPSSSTSTALLVEYFCSEGDSFWKMNDDEILKQALGELQKVGIIANLPTFSGRVIRLPSSYPFYDKEYHEKLELIKQQVSSYKNLQLIGRSGLHRYNNQDHSCLTGFYAAQKLLGFDVSVWDINTDENYQETS